MPIVCKTGARAITKQRDQTTEDEFSELLIACQEIGDAFPEGVVFIGGIAVYFHAINQQKTRGLAEFTHDADIYISMADMSDLRDMEEVIPNRRLNKHQLIKRGFDFDIYTERHSALLVPYDQVIAYAVKYDRIQVASLEHLLVLKLEAYRDRRSSKKGEKDAKDIIRLSLIAQCRKAPFNADLCSGYLSDAHIELLEQIGRGPAFLAIAGGNAKEAKDMRKSYSEVFAPLLSRSSS